MDYSLIPFLFVLVLSFVIGCIFSKSSKKQSDYFLASRQLGWFLLMMTFTATQIGGGFILGTADAASQDGIYAIAFPLGYCLGFLALGLGFGARLRSLELETASDVFERYYGSPLLKRGASLLSIISLTGILIAQAVGLKKFLGTMGFNEEWIFLFSWCIVILYTTQGGFLAVVWTDMVQAVVMIGMLIAVFSFILFSNTISLPVDAFVNPVKWEIAQPKLIGYILMPFLFMFIEQDIVQRCFAGKSKRDVTIGALLAATALFALAFIPVYFGMLSNELQVQAVQGSRFMEVVKSSMNPIMISIASSAVLLAVISTASSLLSAISSNISQDFVDKRANKTLSLKWTKIITLATGVIALGFSYYSSNILTCMIASYELSVACLFVPLVMAVFLKDRCLTLLPAALLSVLFGGSGFVLTKVFSLGILGEIAPLALSCTGYGLGMLYSKKRFVQAEAVMG
jgi:solute:Na+ symporter, SSS family